MSIDPRSRGVAGRDPGGVVGAQRAFAERELGGGQKDENAKTVVFFF